MSLSDDHIALAAEYVLGTLDLAGREEAERLIKDDSEFAAMVHSWEGRFAELHAYVAPVEPPATTWDAIKARIALLRSDDGLREGEAGNVVMLRQRVRTWRRASAAFGAIAAVLAILLAVQAVRPDLLPQSWQRGPQMAAGEGGQFVAVLQQNAAAPAFIMTVDVNKRAFTVRRVSAQPEPGKSFELWIVSDKFDKPRSLGVIGQDAFTTSARLASYDAETIDKATYAVSVEPEGGSPTGVATGPVVFTGKLIDAVPGAR